MEQRPIGIFDSGYGGLTVFKSIQESLPQYDYIYLGDNARAPYGNRSFDTIHQYTLQAVSWFFQMGCPLVLLACNTASAKALRTIQTIDLPNIAPNNRVLGVIIPTAEEIGKSTKTQHIGVLGTRGTISSKTYDIEIGKLYPNIVVHSLACPMWVPIIENGEHNSPGADYYVQKYLDQLLSADPEIDTILLGCTHYPLMLKKIRQHLPDHINIVTQGNIVAEKLDLYLHKHTEIEGLLSKNGSTRFFTTDDVADFEAHADGFFGKPIKAEYLHL
jgi:glutamate racemase